MKQEQGLPRTFASGAKCAGANVDEKGEEKSNYDGKFYDRSGDYGKRHDRYLRGSSDHLARGPDHGKVFGRNKISGEMQTLPVKEIFNCNSSSRDFALAAKPMKRNGGQTFNRTFPGNKCGTRRKGMLK